MSTVEQAAEVLCRKRHLSRWNTRVLNTPCNECTESTFVLFAAGLLVTPEHERKIKAEALREAAGSASARANDRQLIEMSNRWRGYHSGEQDAIKNEAAVLLLRADQIEADHE